jgi:hypothetical protein
MKQLKIKHMSNYMPNKKQHLKMKFIWRHGMSRRHMGCYIVHRPTVYWLAEDEIKELFKKQTPVTTPDSYEDISEFFLW